MQTIKIFVTGEWYGHAGKRTLIHTITELPEPSESENTVPIDFGRIVVDEDAVIYLFGLNENHVNRLQRDGFKAQGWIIVLDGVLPPMQHRAYFVQSWLQMAKELNLLPVIAVNKQDKPGALSPDEIRASLQISADIPVLPCIATDRESVKSVLLALLQRIPLDDVTQKAIARLTSF